MDIIRASTVVATLTFAFAATFGLTPAVLAASASRDALSGTITVFAASSLTEAMTGIGAGFERAHKKVKIVFQFAGSSTLVNQILNGAPADVIATANAPTMAQLESKGLVNSPQTFAHNRLAVALPLGNQKKIRTIADLSKPGILLALCQPQVPCGSAAQAMFALAHLKVQPVTFEPDVKSVLTKVQLSAVDAGIVYNSDIIAAGNQISHIRIPDAFNPPVAYPIAALSTSKQGALNSAFIDYVRSPFGKRALQKSGFLP